MTYFSAKKNYAHNHSDYFCSEARSTDSSSSSEGSPNPKYEMKEKSELCKKFMEKGHCPYGSKCKFAHGSH